MNRQNKTGRPCRPAVLILKLKARSQSLLHRRDALAQAGFVARGGVPVQRTFLDGFVEGGNGLTVGLLGGGLVAFFHGLAQDAQLGAKAGGVGAIGGCALRSLAGALQRRKMICHGWFVTFVCIERYSGGSELLIIGERLGAVKPR